MSERRRDPNGIGEQCSECGTKFDYLDDYENNIELCLPCDKLMHREDCAGRHAKVCPQKIERDKDALAAWTAGTGGWDA